MKKILERGLALTLALVMVIGLLPVTAFAAVDSSGKPTDLNNTLVVSIYVGDGFPGEPAVFGTSDYRNINSSFEVKSGATFASSASGQLIWEKVNQDIVQGTSSGSTSVWGVYDANGTKDYFREDASVINRENEIKMIRAVNGISEAEAQNYEIVWYVIKLQHKPGGWFTRATTEWHIDGVIKEREKISINYYGNGNTSGNAPLGTTSHTAGESYTVRDKNTMVKKINGVEVSFLGWSAKADGTGAEAGFYQPGDVIKPTESISLYAMWDTFTQYTATVRTYLDNVLIDDNDIHNEDRDLYLSTDEIHYHHLERVEEGVYTAKITGNGKFHLYCKNADGTYTQKDPRQLTIYNQNGSLDVHHYSVTYDAAGGEFAADPGKQVYNYGDAVSAVAEMPTKAGHRFLGWQDNNGNLIQPGEEVTTSIDKPITLTAQWEKTVSVTINVTVKHEGGGGLDKVETKDNVHVALVSRENDQGPYLEVEGKTLELDQGIVPAEQKVTKYTGYTYTDMPGGEVDYTVVASKSGYDTEVTAKQDAQGNWTIDVEMVFNPNDFDLDFTIEVDKDVPNRYVPTAAIVKVTFWSNADDEWQLITQQQEPLPGVRVDIDPNTRRGSGSYPVWKYESNGEVPYGYRIRVTSFVYPDGTIVRASNIEGENVEWTDNVYTATMDDVVGGKQFVTLDGAYYDKTSDSQKGTLSAVITMDLYTVTFDAQGGKVNGNGVQTVKEQYKIPSFKDYIPTRDGGYLFDGWYLDKACTQKAVEGTDLSAENTIDGNITLYAKWIEPLTISGTVTISGTYQLNGKTVSVHDIDRATEAVVVLQEIQNGSVYDVDSADIFFGDYEDTGSADYSFTAIPNDGKQYQIHVLLLNYGTDYDNESDSDSEYTLNEYTAVFGGDNVADVDAYLEFEAPSYDQKMNVDATQISESFRPTGALSEVMYRDTGDNHPFHRISQHDVTPFGVKIELNTGTGSGTESIWKWHTNGALYDYQMNITKLYGDVQGVFSSEGTVFNSDTAPYYIIYDTPVYWDASAGKPSGEMKATLVPKQYLITFDLNAGTETVTGMDAYRIVETDADGNSIVTDSYGTPHTWSFDTAITAVPQREGYIFRGWQADVASAYDGSKILANVHEEVVLTAQWDRDCFTVTTAATTGGSTAGDGVYDNGKTATVTATPDAGYVFKGWFEDGELVSADASYSFTVTSNRTLTAKFAEYHTVTVIAQNGGTVSGGGQFEPNATATITAEANDGYYFVGWYDENGTLVTANTSHSLTVLKSHTFTARFEKKVSYKCDYVYIFGYNDSEIGAEGPLLRGELAQMIYRLVKQQYPGTGSGNHTFDDTADEWFKTGVSYMAEVGAIDANRTNAYPFGQVTRGETYKMICLGLGFTADANLDYSDYATILRNSGYLTDDGRVTQKIQRWEFCELFNAILGRGDYCLNGFYDVSGNEVTAETYGYTDLKPSDEYYRTMMIATSAFTGKKIDLAKRAQRNPLDEYNG